MQRVASIARKYQKENPLVVLSALGGVTDQLIEAYDLAVRQRKNDWREKVKKLSFRHRKLVRTLIPAGKLSDKTHDYLQKKIGELNNFLNVTASITVKNDAVYNSVVGLGELLSTYIFSSYRTAIGLPVKWFDIRPVMKINDLDGDLIPDRETIELFARDQLAPYLEQQTIVVTQGFIATDTSGAPVTLGRDGSDYTASLLGEALKVKEIQIWSDVDGILSADPSIVKEAYSLSHMTFDEACELAYFGARVLHPATIQPAVKHGIPVRVLNSRSPGEAGTLITDKGITDTKQVIRSIAYKENITLITIESSKMLLSPRLIQKVFDILTRYGKNVYAVSKAATKLALTIHSKKLSPTFLDELKTFGSVASEQKKAVLSVVGEGIKANPGISWQIIRLLHQQDIGIELLSQFQKQISIMFIIDEKDIEKTVRLLHTHFIEHKYNETD